IKSAVTKYRSNLEFVFYENEEKKETAEENVKEETEKENNKDEKDKKTEKSELEQTDSNTKIDTTKIKILGAVPEFVADDSESYGPFEEGEIVDIPQSAASILINIKKAKKEE
ncbi:MAG: hypothetical protein KAS90_02605, partial [Candidatus Aenigmarchaeota archaeon]|nr:hypothetical protein [Candidatus Aenigmarchaeota archaeon]